MQERIAKAGGSTGNKNPITWTSKYGSVSTAGYEIGICDGMNEKGLIINNALTKSSYYRPDDNNAR
ncbi:MAG: hypothetical protein V8R52_13065 [Coprobacter fastidiosus]